MIGALLCLTSIVAFSCSNAKATNEVGFCDSFKEEVFCHCVAKGWPKQMCENMDFLYKSMINFYDTLDNACHAQNDTTHANCMDNWNCYRKGGLNTHNEKCSSTGLACA
jgi:hypothetical protein